MNRKLLSRTELENLIKKDDKSVKLIQKKKTAKTSECWDYFQFILVQNVRQQFVSCNNCKELVIYSSLNGTNTLRSHINVCSNNDKSKVFFQKTVNDYYSISKPLNLTKSTKIKILEACIEFCTLDGCAFNIIRGEGFTNLMQVLVEVSQSTNKSKFEVASILPHPTTVSATKHYMNRF